MRLLRQARAATRPMLPPCASDETGCGASDRPAPCCWERMQGQIVDHLALHAVPSDPVLLTVLLWMTDNDPAARPTAATCRDIFMWLQHDLWTYGCLCAARLLHTWAMPPHPKLALFPTQVEPAIGPQAGRAPGDTPWLHVPPLCMHEAHASMGSPPALLCSQSMEWPEVRTPCGENLEDGEAVAWVPLCDDAGVGMAAANTCGDAGCCGVRQMPLFDTVFATPPASAQEHARPFHEDRGALSPAHDGPMHASLPDPVLRSSYTSSAARSTHSTNFIATPGLSLPGLLTPRPPAPALPSRPSTLRQTRCNPGSPLTSLHQAFPSCCGPPSAQTSIMSRGGDAAAEDEELPQHGACRAGSEYQPVPDSTPEAGEEWGLVPRADAGAAGGKWVAQGVMRGDSEEFDALVEVPVEQDGGPLGGVCGMLMCCEVGTCAGALLGTLCAEGLVMPAMKARPRFRTGRLR